MGFFNRKISNEFAWIVIMVALVIGIFAITRASY